MMVVRPFLVNVLAAYFHVAPVVFFDVLIRFALTVVGVSRSALILTAITLEQSETAAYP
ncbi:hypothetical protein GCM10027567_21360 [Spongiibacter taiwanensis]